MDNNVKKVIQSVKNVNNPTVKAKTLSFYLSDCLKIKNKYLRGLFIAMGNY